MEMRKYRFGLIQTPEQLRFSYLAIIGGLNQLQKLNKVPLNPDGISSQEINVSKDKASSSSNSDETNSLLPSSPKQKRLSPISGSQSESEAKSSDEERLKSEEEITCNNNLSAERLRRKAREERNMKMEDKIQRIKKKQKESEERSRIKKYIYKYGSFVVILFGLGAALYYKS
jgi:tyrosine-protein phosphatase non-receptor type 1